MLTGATADTASSPERRQRSVAAPAATSRSISSTSNRRANGGAVADTAAQLAGVALEEHAAAATMAASPRSPIRQAEQQAEEQQQQQQQEWARGGQAGGSGASAEGSSHAGGSAGGMKARAAPTASKHCMPRKTLTSVLLCRQPWRGCQRPLSLLFGCQPGALAPPACFTAPQPHSWSCPAPAAVPARWLSGRTRARCARFGPC